MELKEIIQKLQTAIEIYTFFGQYKHKMYSRSMSPKKNCHLNLLEKIFASFREVLKYSSTCQVF